MTSRLCAESARPRDAAQLAGIDSPVNRAPLVTSASRPSFELALRKSGTRWVNLERTLDFYKSPWPNRPEYFPKNRCRLSRDRR